MKRLLELCAVALLCLAYGLAQDTTQKQMTQQPGPPAAKHQRMAMHEHMMKSMQADLDRMHANLQKMKSQLASVKDKGAKEQAQLNIAMWQSLIDTMNKHLQAMKSMAGSGMHDHRGMEHHEHEHEHEHRHGAMPTPTPSPRP